MMIDTGLSVDGRVLRDYYKENRSLPGGKAEE